jgi:molecular chaperone GrpE (heat shock protein)
VTALEQENHRLQQQVVKLEVRAISEKNRYKALEAEFSEYRKSGTVKDLMSAIAKRGRPPLPAIALLRKQRQERA